MAKASLADVFRFLQAMHALREYPQSVPPRNLLTFFLQTLNRRADAAPLAFG
jgi:hypothetical protein